MFNPKAIKKGKKKLEEEIVEMEAKDKSPKSGKNPKGSLVSLEARMAAAKKKNKKSY